MPQQRNVEQPTRPDQESPIIELINFKGLCLKPDIANRPPNSWRRLDNFDLYIPGSIRKIASPSLLSGPFPVVMLSAAEFRSSNGTEQFVYGIGTDSDLYDLSNAATLGIGSGLGALSQIPWMGLLPGTKIPYEFIGWQADFAVTLGQAVTVLALDGNKYIFSCTTAGTTNATAPPIWPTSGTIIDGSVTWTNQGLQSLATFQQNYLVITSSGNQPIKFDGTSVTPVGVSAPTIPINTDPIITEPYSTGNGLALITGRYYAWTWFNPITLHESAPSPIVGSLSASTPRPTGVGTPTTPVSNVALYASELDLTVVIPGAFLPQTGSGTGVLYSSVGLTIPKAVLVPAIGSGFTHLRFYATLDGGNILYLLQNLFSIAGDLLTDANGAVAIAQLATVEGYEAVPITQTQQDQVVVYDGVDDGLGDGSQDSTAANNDLISGGNVTRISLTKGTLTLDPDQAALLYPRSGYFATSIAIPALQGNAWSLEVRFRTKDIVGGVLASMATVQFGSVTIGADSDRYLWINAGGGIHFAYRNAGGSWQQLNSTSGGPYNDGNNHVVDIVGSNSGVELYIDGVLKDSNVTVNNTAFIAYWRFGYGDISQRPEISNKPGSDKYQGVLDEIAWWQTTAISSIIISANVTAAASNANYGPVILAESPTSYWRLDDLSAINHVPTADASLIFPSPALADHYPPPKARWGGIFQGSLVLQDDDDANILWTSDTGDFESFGQFQFVQFQTPNDDDVVGFVGGLNLLVVSTSREVDSLSGTSPSTFIRQPIDSLHGFLGHRCIFPLGSTIIGLMRQGLASFTLDMSFGATSGNVQLGYGNASLIGDDILPILQTIEQSALLYLVCIAIDNTQNILLFAIQDENGQTYNNIVLMYTMGQNPGWSQFLPTPIEYTTIRETIFPDNSIAILALGDDKNVYKLFQTYSGTPLVAIAETQALPVPSQIGGDLWDTDKAFDYFFVEGQDLANFTYQVAVDYPNYTNFLPATPQTVKPGKNLIGQHGKQMVLRLIHAVNPTSPPPLISYIKIAFTFSGRRQQ